MPRKLAKMTKSGRASARAPATARTRRPRLTPRAEKRGLAAADIVLPLTDARVAALVAEVKAVDGVAIGAYREPLSGRAIVLAALPTDAVTPTPFQRDLSPTHAARLALKIAETQSFLDPLIVVRGENGELWTPNGRHRLAAAKTLGLRQITALVSTEPELAFRILALNTEKAHNLKDKSLEVVRMARALAARSPRSKESVYAAQFESAELVTLGIVYESDKRFAGGAYSPFLKRLDRFSDRGLAVSLRARADHAARLLEIDAQIKRLIAALQERGFKSPYLRNYLVARVNPVRFHRAKKGDTTPPMTLSAGLTRMTAAAKKFDLKSVRPGDLALVAAMSSGSEEV